jgi:hypothetical protein
LERAKVAPYIFDFGLGADDCSYTYTRTRQKLFKDMGSEEAVASSQEDSVGRHLCLMVEYRKLWYYWKASVQRESHFNEHDCFLYLPESIILLM